MAETPRIEVRLAQHEQGVVAYLTLHHEAKLNTLTRTLMTRFVSEVEALGRRDDLRALVVSGAGGKAFVGGANIDELAALDRASAKDYIVLVHRTCDCLRQLPVPVVARIDGYALGAGLEVAASCDLRVASTGSRFGMPEVKVGIPSVVEAALIPRLIGWGRARELLLLGQIIDADTALSWGLVGRVVAPDALDQEIDTIVTALLATGAQAVRIQKALIRDWENLPAERAIAGGIDAFVRAFDTDEPARMLGAFAGRKR
jgi:enoyl-CoA hydratase/carnithine racemase